MAKEIEGELRFQKPLAKKHLAYLEAFYSTKRVSRNIFNLENSPDPLRTDVNLPIGKECEFYVGKVKKLNSIEDREAPPGDQPSVWCPFKPTTDGQLLVLDGETLPHPGKLYHFDFPNESEIINNWLIYIINNFISPWGYSLSGKIKMTYTGHSHSRSLEEETFVRLINVKNNCVNFSNFDAFK